MSDQKKAAVPLQQQRGSAGEETPSMERRRMVSEAGAVMEHTEKSDAEQYKDFP